MHLQRVGPGHPALQCVVQCQLESGLAQHGEIVIGPAQPILLRPVRGNGKNTGAGQQQAQGRQPLDGAALGIDIAMQQQALLRVLQQHGFACALPPATVAGVIKTQRSLNQTLAEHLCRRHRRQMQASLWHDAVQCA